MGGDGRRALGWAVVVPVKRLAEAKTRLALPTSRRQDAARALALDLVEAALAASSVRAVWVVTDEAEVARAASALGAVVVPDAPDAGLNPALEHGAEEARRSDATAGVAALAADLPALRPADLDAVLARAAAHPRCVVADADGSGTVLLTALPGVPLAPRFGPGSRAAHLDGGAVDLTERAAASLRRDVDTTDDLRDAADLGLGPRSAGLV